MISERELQPIKNMANPRIFVFGEFSFDALDKVLWRDEKIVSLPPKTCELLCIFIENAGRLLTKEELMSAVWENTFVEEANLSHHIAVLRKSLGEDKNGKKFIQTIPRKGYRFVAPVSQMPKDTLEVTISERTTTQLIEEIETGDVPAQTVNPKLVSQNEISNPAKRFPKRAAIYLSLALLPILGAAIFAWFSFRSNSNTGQIQNPKSKIQNQPAFARLTNSGKVGASSISPDGKFVAYVQNHYEGEAVLYIRQTDTNVESRPVTYKKGTFGMTGFSPDGNYVYYIALDGVNPDRGLYRVPVLGGTPVRLIDKLSNSYFALSPDGAQAAIVRQDGEKKQSNLVAVRLDGSGAERILTTSPHQEMILHGGGTWSPDGPTIVLPVAIAAATRNYTLEINNVMAFDLQRGELRKFTEETWQEFGIMRWIPDASGVVVIAKRPNIRNQIYFINTASGEVSRITNDTNGYGNYGLGITADGSTLVADIWEFQGRIWAMDANGETKNVVRLPSGDTIGSYGITPLPDGRIVFTTRTNSNVDLWVTGEGDTEAKPLTSDAFFDRNPVASPNGSFIVFASDRAGSGTSHLFRMNTDGSRIEQLTFGEGLDDAPDISPDGAFIIYHSGIYDTTKLEWTFTIKKIPSAGGTPLQLTEGCSTPAFSPDGQKFSCVLTPDAYHDKIAVVSAKEGGQLLKTFDVNYMYHYLLPARWTPDGANLIFRSTENQIGNLWKQNLSGGSPARLTDFKSEIIFNFAFSRDGKRLLVSRGNVTVNVVMFKNFK